MTMPPTRVLILGSCASRDPFGSASAPEPGFTVVDYYARTSLASLAHAAPLIDVDVTRIPSSFQRRMVQRDVQKSIFEQLNRLEFDVLLLDFIDDRFDLLVYPDGAALTVSNELRATHSHLRKEVGRVVEPFSEEFQAKWAQGWARLCRHLDKIDRLSSVLINPVLWATNEESGSPLPNQGLIAAANRYLAGLYECLAQALPTQQFISYTGIEFASSAKHRWGPAPFHYTPAVEQACLEGVRQHQRWRSGQCGPRLLDPER